MVMTQARNCILLGIGQVVMYVVDLKIRTILKFDCQIQTKLFQNLFQGEMKMRVHVEDDIFITGDDLGYSLAKRSIVQSGKNAGQEVFTPFKHYSTIAGCIEIGLLKMKLAETTARNLRELLAEVRSLREDIRQKIDF
jgi:hypothetical protein